MRRKIIVRPEAVRDLDAQAEYIAEHSGLDTALRFHLSAQEAFALIATQPRMGRTRTFANPRIRGVRICVMKEFDRHLIFYRPLKGGIEVLRVIHGSRDLEDLFS